jgi:hypothetical protein
MDDVQPELLAPQEASSYLSGKHRIRNSRLTLANRRCAGTGPDFHRRGRSIFYTHAALDAYAARLLSAPMKSTKTPASADPTAIA